MPRRIRPRRHAPRCREIIIMFVIIVIIGCLGLGLLFLLSKSAVVDKILPWKDNFSAPPPKKTLLNLKNFEYIYKPKEAGRTCPKNQTKLIIIAINSARKNFLSRSLVRKTYGSLKQYHGWTFSLVFLLGTQNPCEDETIEERLHREVDKFGDIVLGNFVDSYRNLTYKHFMGFKWAVEFCPWADSYIKADDDNLVHIFHVVHLLNRVWMSSSSSHMDIYCSPNEGLEVWRDNNSIWSSTVEEMSRSKYPRFCANAVYTTGLTTIKRILSATQRVKFFWIDDAFVTGILREYVSIYEGHPINLIRTPVLDYETDKEILSNTTRKWIGLVVPRGPPPYLMCWFWKKILFDLRLSKYYDESCEYAGMYEEL